MVGVSGIGDLGTLPRLPAMARAVARIRARAFDRAIRRTVARHPGVVKSRAWGEPWRAFDTEPDRVFAGDRFHASGAGHEIFSLAGIEVVDRLLAAQPLSSSSESHESSM